MQINYDKEYDIEISAGKLKNFSLELSLITKEINFNIPINKNKNKYSWIVPSLLKSFIDDKIECKIYFYYKNNRFTIHSDTIRIISDIPKPETVEIVQILESEAIINETAPKNLEINLDFSIKNGLDLSSLINNSYQKTKLNLRVKKLLKSIK